MNAGAYGARDDGRAGPGRGARRQGPAPQPRPRRARLHLSPLAPCPRAGSSPRPCSPARPATRPRSRRRMAEIRDAREESQPLRTRTGGSTFTNPPGAKAWQLIDRAGCRGLQPRRRPGFREALQFPDQHRHGHRRRHRGSGRGGAPPGARGDGRRARLGDPTHRPSRRRRVNQLRGGRMSRRVAVLMGGWSSEREVSLTSGRGCAAALGRLGYDGDHDRRQPRRGGAGQGAHPEAGRGVQRAARPLRRGRQHPGPAQHPRHPLHPFRPARLGASPWTSR